MKKKTISILAITLVFGLTMTGCAKTPDQALVAQKNNERLEEAAKAEPQDGTSLQEVAATTTSTYDFTYSSEDGRISIQADQVPVTLPVKDTIPMYHVSCGEIPQEVADKVYDYFFPEGGYTFTGTDRTRAKIDEEILELQQGMATVKDDAHLPDEEKEEYIQNLEGMLADLQEQRKDAPEQSTLKLEPKDSTYGEELYDTMSGPKQVKALNVVSKDQKSFLYITSADANSPVASSLGFEGDASWAYSPDAGSPVDMCSDAEIAQIGISLEDAAAVVNDFTDKIGMNWEIHDISCVKGYKDVGDIKGDSEMTYSTDYTAFQFVLTQSIDGIQSAVTSSAEVPEDDSSVDWLYEQISIFVESKGIVKVNWHYPVVVEDTVSENVGIISFDAAKDIFENMMPLTAKGDLERWNDEYLEIKETINVSDVRLGLMRVRNNGSDRTGLMTPVWLFYGDYNRSFHYLPGAEALLHGGEDYEFAEPHPWILLAINAVDGSVIDITEGY